MRSKEEAHDYRYFRIRICRRCRDGRAHRRDPRDAAELPEAKRGAGSVSSASPRATRKCSARTRARALLRADRRCGGRPLATTEHRAAAGKRCANFVQAEVLRYVSMHGSGPRCRSRWTRSSSCSPRRARTISGKMAKESSPRWWDGHAGQEDRRRARARAGQRHRCHRGRRARGARAERLAGRALQAGKTNVLGFFVGAVMKATKARRIPRSSTTS